MYTILKCTECDEPLTEAMISHGEWKYTTDHKGLCCDCFDVGLGAHRTIKLNRRTPLRLHDFDDYDIG